MDVTTVHFNQRLEPIELHVFDFSSDGINATIRDAVISLVLGSKPEELKKTVPENRPEPLPLITAKKCSEILGVRYNTMTKMMREGRFPLTPVERKCMARPEHVEEYLRDPKAWRRNHSNKLPGR
jgi:hypothetical protein